MKKFNETLGQEGRIKNEVKISDLKEIQEFKEFYENCLNEDLLQSIEKFGQLRPISITPDNEILDGYRVVDSLKRLGKETVKVNYIDQQPDLYLRITLNSAREKTTKDKVREIIETFKYFPKKQGIKSGQGYNRYNKISECLNNRWSSDKVIPKLEYITNNDIGDHYLLSQIIENKFKVEPCYDYLKNLRSIDLEKNFGYSNELLEGRYSISDTNKLIKQHQALEKYEPTFIIPDKVNSYQINALNLDGLRFHHSRIDSIITSPPYFMLRTYNSENENNNDDELGHEGTPEKYCTNVSKIFKSLVPLLKQTSNVFINIGETYKNGVGLGIPQMLKQHIEKNTPLIYKDTIMWSKINSKPQNENIKRLFSNTEDILWFVLDPDKSKFNLLTYMRNDWCAKISNGCKDVDERGIVYQKNISLTKPYKKFFNFLKEQEVYDVIKTSVGQNHEILNIMSEGHPASMSPLLPVVPILMTTDEGDTVLDPFSGSNIVGKVSLLLNRQVVSAELSKKYHKIGCQILQNAIGEFNRKDLDFLNEFIYLNDEAVSGDYQNAA